MCCKLLKKSLAVMLFFWSLSSSSCQNDKAHLDERWTTYLFIKNIVWFSLSGGIGAQGQCTAEPLQYLKIVFFLSNQIPALMAPFSIPSNAALVQSTKELASFSKISLPQTIAVLRTDGRVKWGVEDVAGLVAHWCDLVFLLLFFLINF